MADNVHDLERYGCSREERDRIQRVHSGGKWEQSPFGVFSMNRSNARRRGVDWNLTFAEWWEVWEMSGKWNKRGIKSGQYCMARLCGDGPYEYGNVHIVPVEDHRQEIANMKRVGVWGAETEGAAMTEEDWKKIKELADSLP